MVVVVEKPDLNEQKKKLNEKKTVLGKETAAGNTYIIVGIRENKKKSRKQFFGAVSNKNIILIERQGNRRRGKK